MLSLIHIYYDIPNLKLSEQPETSIGKYGRLRNSYLQDHRQMCIRDSLQTMREQGEKVQTEPEKKAPSGRDAER